MRRDRINLTTFARLHGCALSQASRITTAGKLGPVQRTPEGVFVDLAEVERFIGHPVSDAELEAATTKPKPAKPALSDEDFLRTLDPGTAAYFAERRDSSWVAHLTALGLWPIPLPKASDFCAPILDAQQFFTRHQVEELLAAALAQHDRQWRDWCASDLVHQAQNPDGPQPLALKSIQLEE